MRKYITLVALLLPLTALAFPFAVDEQLNGVQIAVDTQDLGDNRPP